MMSGSLVPEQGDRRPRPLQIGDEIPNFSCDSQMGMMTLHHYINGGWGVILAYPRNNDPVACTELGMLSKLSEEFEERNCKLVAISVDSKMGHRSFIKDTQELQDCQLKFPIVADANGDIFALFGLVREDAIDPTQGIVSQTTVIVTDLDLRVRMICQYPSTVGHNYYEASKGYIRSATRDISWLRSIVQANAGQHPTLRAIDALQQATFNRIGIPANWKEGEDVLIDTRVPSSYAKEMFPKGFVELRPWFRVTPQPDHD